MVPMTAYTVLERLSIRFCDASVPRHSGEQRSPRVHRVEVRALRRPVKFFHIKIKPCLTKPIAGDERSNTNPDEQPHNFIPTPLNLAAGTMPRCAKFSRPPSIPGSTKRRSVICPSSEQWRCALRHSAQRLTLDFNLRPARSCSVMETYSIKLLAQLTLISAEAQNSAIVDPASSHGLLRSPDQVSEIHNEEMQPNPLLHMVNLGIESRNLWEWEVWCLSSRKMSPATSEI